MSSVATRTVASGPRHAEGCLFCRRSDGGFTSREHVFSEALGNHDYVLDPGIVCDRCNNGPLARADEALTNFPPITLLRAERGLPTKSGKPVVAKFGNAHVAFSGPGELNVINPGKKVMRRMPPSGGRMPPEGGKMDLTSGGPITRDRFRYIIRAVWKSALELIYWDRGMKAFHPIFDDARQAIISSEKVRGWAVAPKQATAEEDVTLEYQPRVIEGRMALPVRMSVFGVVIYTDLLRRDLIEEQIKPPWEANVWVV